MMQKIVLLLATLVLPLALPANAAKNCQGTESCYPLLKLNAECGKNCSLNNCSDSCMQSTTTLLPNLCNNCCKNNCCNDSSENYCTTYNPYCKQQKERIINDSSKIDATVVNRIVRVTTEEEISNALAFARNNNLKVSIAGLRQTQGGQAFYDNALVIDMTIYNKILALDIASERITVQAGTTWEQVQRTLAPHRLAVRVMQPQNFFTVGGSLSIDAHGLDWRFGSLGNTVESFRLMNADGSITTVTPSSNQELFDLVIGGYGLFGVILDVTLKATEDVILELESKAVCVGDYTKFVLKRVVPNPSAQLHSGCFANKNLDKIIAWTFEESTSQPCELFKITCPQYQALRQALYGIIGKFPSLQCTSKLPASLMSCRGSTLISRNNAMNFEPDYVAGECKTTLIQEFFVPAAQFCPFIKGLKKSLECNHLCAVGIQTEFVPTSTDTYLSYARQPDLFAVYVPVVVGTDSHAVAVFDKWARSAIELALAAGGTYNLAYRLVGTQDQIKRGYPDITDFMDKKRQYDPNELFYTKFYDKYRNA